MKKIILLSLICVIILIGLTACGKSDKSKMIEYLESVDYICVENDNNEYICTRRDGTIVETVIVRDDSDKLDVIYTYEIENGYKISSIRTSIYITMRQFTPQYQDLSGLGYGTSTYIPEEYQDSKDYDEMHFSVGSKSVPENSSTEDFSKYIDKALREFESYYENAGIKLGK